MQGRQVRRRGGSDREAVDAAVRHLYALDLAAGWGVHVVQEVKLLARKDDREGLDAAIQELVDIGIQRLIKDFERVVKDEAAHADPNTARMLNDRKQSLIKELNSYVAQQEQHATENKQVNLFDGPSVDDGFGEENVLLASNMSNQQLMHHGDNLMNETHQAIARSKQTVQETVNVGTETAAALKAQIVSYYRI